MTHNDTNIGKLIKHKRLEKGLTLETVANKVGVGKSTVSKWERGAIKNMKKDKIDALSLRSQFASRWKTPPRQRELLRETLSELLLPVR